MKKLFTFLALLTCFLGANAVEITDFEKTFGAGHKQAWKDDAVKDEWVTADEDGFHLYNPEVIDPWYSYQVMVTGGIMLEPEAQYTVKIVAKVSDGTANVRCRVGGWSNGIDATLAVNSTEYQEYTYTGAATVSDNFFLVQFGDYVGTVSLKSIKVTHEGKEERPAQWQEWLTSDGKSVVIGEDPIPTYRGDAEFGKWPDWALTIDDETGANINWRGERSNEICAWSIVRGQNIDPSQTPDPVKAPDSEGGYVIEAGKPRPFPCNIEEVAAEGIQKGGHAFVVHSTAADNQFPDWQAWDNQFFIMSPKSWKEGETVRIKFKAKAEKAATAQTQIHHKNPSWYLHYVGIGDIAFTTEWKEYSVNLTFSEAQAGNGDGYCVAFNLNVDNKEPNTFYFDDLSWASMVLDDGWFVASSNNGTGIEYDYDNAIEFAQDPNDADLLVATVGTVGKKDTWVDEVMISTVRGNDSAFKGATIKLSEAFADGEDEWIGYEAGKSAKIKLNAAGVWKISISLGDKLINFVKLEGEDAKEPVDIVTNPSVLVINGVERQPTSNEQPADPDKGIAEGTGQTWDNQFFIVANRVLEGGEKTVIEFDYVATAPAKVLTGTHAAPGDYRKGAFGDVEFTTEEQHLKKEYEIPSVGWDGSTVLTGMQSISFDMAVIKEANTYTIKNVKWYLANDTEGKTTENLINATGTDNFQVKIGAGNKVLPYGSETGIENVAAKNAKTSTVIYNLAGQRVSNGFKGLVIMDGKKIVK